MKARQRHGETEEERQRKDRQTHPFIILSPKTSAEASHRHAPSAPPLQAALPLHLHSTDTLFSSQHPPPAASKADRSTHGPLLTPPWGSHQYATVVSLSCFLAHLAPKDM